MNQEKDYVNLNLFLMLPAGARREYFSKTVYCQFKRIEWLWVDSISDGKLISGKLVDRINLFLMD